MSKTGTGLTAATTPLAGTEVVYLVQGGNSRKTTSASFYIPGGTDVAVADGGTGSSTASGARTNLGLAIGTDVQAFDADLSSWAGVTRSAGFDAFAATPSSANLATLLTDETGTGANVFATSPTLVTPALGTPSAAVLTNATGLPVSTGISGLAAGVATFLATPSSANLKAALTDETGSGAAVFATSPTLVTPILGVAAATSVNFGGTALSVYAEGTFTPAFSATSSTFSHNIQSGTYTRIGRLVQFEIAISLNTSGNTLTANALSITGLPFTSSSTAAAQPVRWNASTTSYVSVTGRVAGTAIVLEALTAAATGPSGALANGLLHATNGTALWMIGTYIV